MEKSTRDNVLYEIAIMNGYEVYHILKKELNFDDMIILYKLITHKMVNLDDEPRNYNVCCSQENE